MIDHERMEMDLGIGFPFVKGRDYPVKNCWHFNTDGNCVDVLFVDEEDFKAGMNRIFVVKQDYEIAILAFALMDTHVHFVLYGAFRECNSFMHEYVRRTSSYISIKYGERHKLKNLVIQHQEVDTGFYLKVVICYTVKNPPVGGIAFNAYDYPWSSGGLYFRPRGYWTSPNWKESIVGVGEELSSNEIKKYLKTHIRPYPKAHIINGLIFPGDFVEYATVEKIFRTCKGFNFFLCRSKEEDVEAKGGSISLLSLPLQEMREHRNEICKELFDKEGIRSLTTQQRIRLAKTMKARYNSSTKQIIRLSGLIYDEVKSMI